MGPNAVGRDAAELVHAHMGRLAFVLSPGIAWHDQGKTDAAATQIAMTMGDLTRYAQAGEFGDWPDASCALDAIQTVCAALYSCAGTPGTFDVGAISDLHSGVPEDAIGLALVGAMARVHLAQRSAGLSAKELAALAGLSDDHVRLLARKGELTLQDGSVAKREARRFLASRGVKGL